jgi:hypothetical protein
MDMAPRKTAKTAKTPQTKGMRIQLKGLRTTRELRAMLHEAVDQIEALGLKRVRGSNLYITPADEQGNPLTHIAKGKKIPDIIIAEPYRSAAEEHGL